MERKNRVEAKRDIKDDNRPSVNVTSKKDKWEVTTPGIKHNWGNVTTSDFASANKHATFLSDELGINIKYIDKVKEQKSQSKEKTSEKNIIESQKLMNRKDNKGRGTIKNEVGYKDHQAKLQEGATLLVEARLDMLKASFSDDHKVRANEKNAADLKETKAYKMLSSGSVNDISGFVKKAVRNLNEKTIQSVPVDWNQVGGNQAKVVDYQKSIKEIGKTIQFKASNVMLKIDKEYQVKRDKQMNHDDLRPSRPKGLLAPFKMTKYKQDYNSWKVEDTVINKRIESLKNRKNVVSKYNKRSLSIARMNIRKQNPKLAKEVDKIQANESKQLIKMINIDQENDKENTKAMGISR